jgi:hypothetical protein
MSDSQNYVCHFPKAFPQVFPKTFPPPLRAGGRSLLTAW